MHTRYMHVNEAVTELLFLFTPHILLYVLTFRPPIHLINHSTAFQVGILS